MWRLAHGELTAELAADAQLSFAMLIGTNNLGHGHLPDETHAGIVAAASALLNRTRGRLLLLRAEDFFADVPKAMARVQAHVGLPDGIPPMPDDGSMPVVDSDPATAIGPTSIEAAKINNLLRTNPLRRTCPRPSRSPTPSMHTHSRCPALPHIIAPTVRLE